MTVSPCILKQHYQLQHLTRRDFSFSHVLISEVKATVILYVHFNFLFIFAVESQFYIHMKKVKDNSLSAENILSSKIWLLCSLIYCLVGQDTKPHAPIFLLWAGMVFSPLSVIDKSEELAFSEDKLQFLNIKLIISDSALETLYLPT